MYEKHLLIVSLLLASQPLGAQQVVERSGVWLALSPGYGVMSGFPESGNEGVMVGGLAVGGTMSPRLQVGVSSIAFTRWLQDAEPSRGQLAATGIMVTARWYPPSPNGLMIAAGVGRATLSGALSSPVTDPASGFGAMASVGWELPLGGSVALMPHLNGFRASAGGISIGAVNLGLALVVN